jgi:fucose 4-O-acetylase-like acetyltransferase
MPLFVLVSGYFCNPQSPNFKKGILRIAETYIVVQVVRSFIENGVNIFALLMPRMAMWYLLSLVYWKLMILICPLKDNKYTLIFLSVIISFAAGVVPFTTIMSFQRTFSFLPFFVVGYCLRNVDYRRYLNSVKPANAIVILSAVFIGFYAMNCSFLDTFSGVNSLVNWGG